MFELTVKGTLTARQDYAEGSASVEYGDHQSVNLIDILEDHFSGKCVLLTVKGNELIIKVDEK